MQKNTLPGNDPAARNLAKQMDKGQSQIFSDTLQSQEATQYVTALNTAIGSGQTSEISKKVTDLVNAGGQPRMIEGQPLTKEDRDYSLLHSLANKDGIVPGYGKVQLDQKFFDWVKKQQDQAFAYNFRDYVYKQIKLNTPEAREFWTARFPDWTKRVYEAYEQQAEIDKRLTLISLHGVKDESDLWLLFMRDRGMLYTSQETQREGQLFGYGSASRPTPYPQRPEATASQRGAFQQLPPAAWRSGFPANNIL